MKVYLASIVVDGNCAVWAFDRMPTIEEVRERALKDLGDDECFRLHISEEEVIHLPEGDFGLC